MLLVQEPELLRIFYPESNSIGLLLKRLYEEVHLATNSILRTVAQREDGEVESILDLLDCIDLCSHYRRGEDMRCRNMSGNNWGVCFGC